MMQKLLIGVTADEMCEYLEQEKLLAEKKNYTD